MWMTILILLDCVSICFGITCMLGNGRPVDWFIVYKLPKLTDRAEPFKSGRGYFYMHGQDQNNNYQLQWRLSANGVHDQNNNPLYWTLNGLYTNTPDLEYTMYSDQPPTGNARRSPYGHSKGVVAFDKTDGFWLIHSVPKYPPPRQNGYSFPDNGYKNGQTFLCVSYNRNMMGLIYIQLMYIWPFVYDRFPSRKATELKSKNGVSVYHFVKDKEYNADLYNCFVAEILKDDLKVVAWKLASGVQMNPNCISQYTVRDEGCVLFNMVDPTLRNYDTTKEHSKWAIGRTEPLTCIGDINREDSQKDRGGGTACILNQQIWNQFNKLVQPPIFPTLPPGIENG